MDGSLKLIILSAVMLFGSYLSGSIPLFISLSEEKLQVSSSTVVNESKTNYTELIMRSLIIEFSPFYCM